MSLFADERVRIMGKTGTGSVATYTLSKLQRLRVETIVFTFVTSAATKTHFPEVQFTDQAGNVITAIEDWNAVADSQTVTYTFGIGLVAFCGSASTGAIIQNTLPDTVLENQATITLNALDSGGGVIAGDQFLGVSLYAAVEAMAPVTDVIPLLTPLALAG